MSDTQSDCVGWPEYATTKYKEKSEKKERKKKKEKMLATIYAYVQF